jgi:hypothetical protein
VFFFKHSVLTFASFFNLGKFFLELINVLLRLGSKHGVLVSFVFYLLLSFQHVLLAIVDLDHGRSVWISFQLLSSFSCLFGACVIGFELLNVYPNRSTTKNLDAPDIAILRFPSVILGFTVLVPVGAWHAFATLITCVPSSSFFCFPLCSNIKELSFFVILVHFVYLPLVVRSRSFKDFLKRDYFPSISFPVRNLVFFKLLLTSFHTNI